MRNALTQKDVRELLDYNPITGALTNKVSRARAAQGDVAGFVDYQGYRMVKIKGFRYSAGRIIWLWMTGAWPACEIDHINTIRDDDRFENLREASRSENCVNKNSYARKNRLGFRGVKAGTKNTFQAVICVGQKETYVGTFSTLEIAALAYDLAAKKQHGRFARLNFPEKAHRDWLIP